MFLSNPAAKRILFCTKGTCADPDDARELLAHAETLIADHGLDNPDHPQHTVCAAVNCLGVCHSGPVIMVNPDTVRYGKLDKPALKRIIESHIVNDTPLAALVLPYPQTKKIRR